MADKKTNNLPLGARAGGMIAVIADDFTGAAEIAGISLRYGLSVSIHLDTVGINNTDVVIVSTDSRSMEREEALKVTASGVKELLKLNPSFIYKKIDSVLRGYVIAEARLQMELSGKSRILIVPANPSLKRTIENGEYFIDGKKIASTSFAKDPEFPVNSSSVKKMVNDDTVKLAIYTDQLPASGIVIGETATTNDTKAWVNLLDDSSVPVGGADFFDAILGEQYQLKPQQDTVLGSPHLYVCGTAFKERKAFIKTLDEKLDCVSYLPGLITEDWMEKTCAIVEQQKRLVIAIDGLDTPAALLRLRMAKAVKQIIERSGIKEIFIEGGSTAAALLQELKITKLELVNELSRGVVRMKTNDLFITVKPGSYELPAEIVKLYE